jgi:hypothetical protein
MRTRKQIERSLKKITNEYGYPSAELAVKLLLEVELDTRDMIAGFIHSFTRRRKK